MLVRNNLVERKIKIRRVSSKRFFEFKEKWRLDPNKYSFDEQDIISALHILFEGKIMHTQDCVQNKRLDLYLSKRKLGIEIGSSNNINDPCAKLCVSDVLKT